MDHFLICNLAACLDKSILQPCKRRSTRLRYLHLPRTCIYILWATWVRLCGIQDCCMFHHATPSSSRKRTITGTHTICNYAHGASQRAVGQPKSCSLGGGGGVVFPCRVYVRGCRGLRGHADFQVTNQGGLMTSCIVASAIYSARKGGGGGGSEGSVAVLYFHPTDSPSCRGSVEHTWLQSCQPPLPGLKFSPDHTSAWCWGRSEIWWLEEVVEAHMALHSGRLLQHLYAAGHPWNNTTYLNTTFLR